MEISENIEDNSTNNWFRKSPIQRQRWGDTQVLPHTDWGDLFFDLFYVVSTTVVVATTILFFRLLLASTSTRAY
jgi:hypothetical protein